MTDLNPYEEGLAIDLAKAADRIEKLQATISEAAKFIEFLDANYSHVFGNTAREKIRALYAELKGE